MVRVAVACVTTRSNGTAVAKLIAGGFGRQINNFCNNSFRFWEINETRKDITGAKCVECGKGYISPGGMCPVCYGVYRQGYHATILTYQANEQKAIEAVIAHCNNCGIQELVAILKKKLFSTEIRQILVV